MTALRGGLPQPKLIPDMTDAEFLAHYISSITPTEWRFVASMPALPRRSALACLVAELRRWPLLPNHPLNPAHRYEGIS